MTFDEAMAEAAKTAEAAVDAVMHDYASRLLTDEDDINPAIVGALRMAFTAQPVGHLKWNASVLRHRSGVANEESEIGADIMVHVELKTPSQSYSKGILIQAKRLEPGRNLTTAQQTELRGQCDRMLDFSPAAFVMNYSKSGMRSVLLLHAYLARQTGSCTPCATSRLIVSFSNSSDALREIDESRVPSPEISSFHM